MTGLNESPSEKEGKCRAGLPAPRWLPCLNESPSEKEGKCTGTDITEETTTMPQ